MLLEFGFRNFLAFKDGVSVSFRLDSNCPKSISNGLDVTPILCIKGANASGKTNILRALALISSFSTKSFSDDSDGKIAVVPHFDSIKPVEFYAEFRDGKVEYRYELAIRPEEVVREALFRKKVKQVRLCERTASGVKFTTKEFSRLKSMKVRKNASVVSTARQFGFEEIDPIYDFFNSFLTNVGYLGLAETLPDEHLVSKLLHEDPSYLEFVRNFISECDVGLTDIQILKVPNPDESGDRYFPVFYHGDGVERGVLRHTESSGTRALFRKLAAYKWALDWGGVVIADELDIHLHPMVLTKLLGLFLSKESNPKHAQMLFTTHSEEVLNFLGRYRTYLVNKEDNESYAYRLDEIPGTILRNDRPILPAYKEGKIGGVPRL